SGYTTFDKKRVLSKVHALAPRKLARYPKIGLVLPESQHCMTSDSRRLAILTAREINELYGLPCFTDQKRCIYFDLSPAEHDAVDAVHTDAAGRSTWFSNSAISRQSASSLSM